MSGPPISTFVRGAWVGAGNIVLTYSTLFMETFWAIPTQ